MNFQFENQGTYTYLVYTIGEGDSVDSMSLGMLTNNRIVGLAPTIFTQMDNTRYIKYNVSARISVKQFFTGPVNRKRLLGVFSGIVNGLLSAEDYMIDTDSIILDLDYIFVNVSTCSTVLICLPVSGANSAKTDLGMFFKNIMFNIQSDQTENCSHVAEIINYLNSAPVFSLTDFKNVLDRLQSGTPAAAPPVQAVKPAQAPVQPAAAPMPPVQPAAGHFGAQQPQRQPAAPVQPVSPSKPVQTPPPFNHIPQQQPPVPQQQPPIPQQQAPVPEKPMSMFGLLMHYSKENAAVYKAQKEARKSKGGTKAQQAPNASFAVPGAPQQPAAAPAPKQQGMNPGFAIPGQAAQAPAPVQPAAQAPVQPAAPQFAPVSTAAQKPAQPPVNRPAAPPDPIAPQGRPLNFGETTVLSGGAVGETTILSALQMPARALTPFLIRSKNNEKIAIDKPVFRIGKERSYVDYFIGDNTAVSRSHANIVTRDGQYFIMDTNSTNHTYVNGIMIQSNVETKINDGDRIRIANEDFEFKLM